jgi:NAD(P)-dependent dehydrogenase (short-subunit alcohol dehydrogenase family)
MNKTIIIAGSEGLLGTEITKYLEALGNTIVRCDLCLGHDLTDEVFVKDFFKTNKADCLINLYALNPHVDSKVHSTNMFDITLDSLDSYLQVNLLSLFSVCREYARNNKKGSIINFSSTYGLVSPDPSLYERKKEKHIGYCLSKAGVVQLTKYLAVHLAPNIKVNCIAPGGVMFEATNNHSKKFIEKYKEKTPMKRMMNADELNGIVEYLCSEKASYATGAVFNVDGGWTTW